MHNSLEPSQASVAREMVVQLSALTDVGKLREHNEDNFLVCSNLAEGNWFLAEAPFVLSEAGSLLAVADGMGGENAGEVASAIAVEAIKEYFGELVTKSIPPNAELGKTLVKAALFAHRRIVEHARQHPECDGMGTTLMLAWILRQSAYIVWSGDSRCYLYRENEGLRILSNDHSLVWELVMEGKLDVDEAENHPDSHIITQSLGDSKHPPEPDVTVQPLQPGDKLLLCSDGLNGMLPSKAIQRIMSQKQPLNEVCRQLIDAANRNGGEDNITVVTLEVLKAPKSQEGLAGTALEENVGANGLDFDSEALPDQITRPQGILTPKTHKTLRRPVLPGIGLPARAAQSSRLIWYALAGLLVLVGGGYFLSRESAYQAPNERNQNSSVSGSTAEAPPFDEKKANESPMQAIQLEKGPESISMAVHQELKEEDFKPLVQQVKDLFTRYDRAINQIDRMESDATSLTPVPAKDALVEAAANIPGYDDLRAVKTDVGIESALRKNLKSQEDIGNMTTKLRELRSQLKSVEGKLR